MGAHASTRTEYQIPPSARLIDKACDRFESAFHAGQTPRIEEYLAGVDASFRRTLLRELLLLEIELSPPSAGSSRLGPYRARFPREADVVDAAFAEAARDPARSHSIVDSKSARGKLSVSRIAPPTVGRYVIVAKLVEDSEGVVYRVLRPGLGKDLVLIWARRPVAADAGRDESLAEEERRLTDLDHPNLGRVVELGDHEGRPYVVIENAPGLDFAQHRARHRPAARSAASILADLASAIAYLHDRGLVHQNVRPGNVLIDTTGRPRLILSPPAGLRHAGSPSPEFEEPSRPATAVFDLGALLYELLTGRPFERGATVSQAGPSPIRVTGSRVPKTLERVFLRAVSQDPRVRYPGPGDFEKALRRYLRRRLIVAGALSTFAFLLFTLFAIVARK